MKKKLFLFVLLCFLFLSCEEVEEAYSYSNHFSLYLTNIDGTNNRLILADLAPFSSTYFIDNNTKLLIVLNSGEIIELDIDSGTKVTYSNGNLSIRNSILSHDRKKLALINTGSGNQDVYIFDIITKNFTKMTDTPNYFKRDVSFSNDDSKLLYTIVKPNYAAIESITLSTGVINEITRNASLNYTSLPFYYPVYGTNDSRVYYLLVEYVTPSSLRSTNNELLDTLSIISFGLTFSGSNGFLVYERSSYPASVIAYNTLQHTNLELATVTYAGGITNISEDGAKVLLGTDNGYSNEDITIVNIDGTDKKVICRGLNPSLSSDGLKIAYTYMERVQTY